jgi:hypothetical protein
MGDAGSKPEPCLKLPYTHACVCQATSAHQGPALLRMLLCCELLGGSGTNLCAINGKLTGTWYQGVLY